jgi:hypothetical protein
VYAESQPRTFTKSLEGPPPTAEIPVPLQPRFVPARKRPLEVFCPAYSHESLRRGSHRTPPTKSFPFNGFRSCARTLASTTLLFSRISFTTPCTPRGGTPQSEHSAKSARWTTAESTKTPVPETVRPEPTRNAQLSGPKGGICRTRDDCTEYRREGADCLRDGT